MGTAKKLVLASLVSTMMVLMFAIGFLPSLGVVDVGAAEKGERLDMVRFLKLFLTEEKQLTDVEITSPVNGQVLTFLNTSMEFPLEASAVTTPEGQGASVAFGVDGDLVPAAGAWRGELVGVADAEGNATIDLGSLTVLDGLHDLFALAVSQLVKQSEVYQSYDVFDQIVFDVNLLDAATADVNGDGIIDNPFANLGPGERVRTVVTRDGVTKIIIVKDLDETAKGILNPVGVTLEEEDANGKPIVIESPTRDELEAAGAIAPGAEAVLVAVISSSLDAVLNTDASPNEADNIGAFPASSDGTTPIAGIGFGVSYVDVSIIYSSDMGATSDEIAAPLPDGMTVNLQYGELDGVTVDATSGAGQWSHSTDVDDMTTITVSPSAGWEKKSSSFLDTVSATLKTYMSYLSIFAPLESQFAVTDVNPPAAMGTAVAEDSAIVTVNGNIPLAGANISSAAEAAAAYRVYFGDPFANGTEAEFVEIPSGAKQLDDIVTATSVTVRVPAVVINDNTTVDVWVFDADATSDFATAMDAFTFAVQPAVFSIEPNTGPLVNPPNSVITGLNLDTVQSVIFRDTLNSVEAPATIVTGTSTSLTVTPPNSPSGDPGPVEVVVTTAGGESPNKPVYTYRAMPTATAVNPAELAFDAVDRTVVITGTNLFNVVSVTLAGLPVGIGDIVESVDGTTLTVTAPAGPSLGATGPVRVVTAGGDTGDVLTFTFLPEVTGPEPIAVDSVSPDNAWVFGGVVARITGSGFTEVGDGMPTVMFGTTEAAVLAASDTEIYVEVPARTGVTGQSADVDVTVSRTVNAKGVVDPNTATYEGFTYYRFFEANGVTTTAGTLAGGVGNVSVVLDSDSPATTATLNIPTAFNTAKGSTDRATLVRASKAPADFGLSPAANGANATDAWVFDFHLYSLDYNTGNVTFTTGGVPTILEITDLAQFDPKNAATLSTPVGSTSLAEANLASIALYGEVTALDQPYPAGPANFTPGSGEVYQSQLMTGEFTSDGTTISALANARLGSLGAIAIRTGVIPDISGFDITLEKATKGVTTPSGDISVVTELLIHSDQGGLGFLSNPAFGDTLTTAAGFDAAVFGTLGDANGVSEFDRSIRTPTEADGITVGVKDVGLILAADPDPAVPAFVFVDGFQFTKATPPTGLLRILLALLGLIGAGGGGGGGGGGGPCFIATAAYGTPMAAEIDTLRAVRDSYLLDNAVGTAFVDTYYRVSPAIADVVAQSPALAAAVRLMLVPVVFMAQVFMASPAISLGFLMLALGVVIMRRRKGKASRA